MGQRKSRQTKRKRGRPKLPPGKKRSEKISIALTKAEKGKIDAAAKKEGVRGCDILMRPWRK